MNPNKEYRLTHNALRMLKASARGCVVLESEKPIGQLLVDQDLAEWDRNDDDEMVLNAAVDGHRLLIAAAA